MAFRSAASAAGSANNLTVTKPAGTASGDILLAFWTNAGNGNSTITWPSGFTLEASANLSTPDTTTIRCASKVAGGSEPADYNIQSSTNDACCAAIIAISGRDTGAAITPQATTNTGTLSSPVTVTLTGVTAANGDDLIWMAAPSLTGTNPGTYTAPGSFTERVDVAHTQYASMGIATRDNVSAGATGDISGTLTGASPCGYGGFVINLAASGGGSSDTPITVDVGSGAGEGQNIDLISTEAYVIPVTVGQAVGEGEAIPFILAQPGTAGAAVGQGQDIGLLTPGGITVDVGSGCGAGQDITLTLAADTTPDAFSFTDLFGTATSAAITSAPITVSGINTAAEITVTDGEYSINGGAFTADAGEVSEGDQVRARHTSSASYATSTSCVVTIGGVSDTFTSLTGADPLAAGSHGHSANPGGMGRMMGRS